ncbi:alpha-2-macroglobulin-like [Scleropages formosus]|uniref:alpha-2-macroglobulin-like n=1 Tax=Scleropages formosus TaxID=113540 RepID=UPI0010FA8DCA|nr:alpha-2-macroglobulin-like [Scleropages formosus]
MILFFRPNMFGFFIVFLLLSTADTQTVEKSMYMVAVTSNTVSGSTETLCAQLLPKDSVTFTIVLKVNGERDRFLLNETVSEDFSQCVSFQVPAVSTATIATIHATVRSPTETLENTTKILINTHTSFAIIQTDKPIYKPGQTVMFRIVTLDDNILPFNKLYPTVALKDPNNNRIVQWLNQSSASGILDFSYPMTPEAVQGVYVINAWDKQGRETSRTFKIERYVLPKYEVKVHLPDVIFAQDTELTMKVCGKYTYGKPVLGSVKVEVHLRPTWLTYGHQSFPSFKYNMRTNKTGCATNIINLIPMKLNQAFHMNTLTFDCVIEEHETGEVLHGSGSVQIQRQEFVIVSFEDTVSTFRPGIPYEVKVKVTGARSTLPNAPVVLVVNQETRWMLTTDSKGVARFSLNTSSWTSEYVRLEAHYKEYRSPSYPLFPSHIPHFSQTHFIPAHASVMKFYSKSKNFVKIMQAYGELPCDQEGLLKVKYIIHGTALQNSEEFLNFFYLVLLRGRAVHHGHLQIAVKKDKVNKGEFTLQLQHTRELVPYAQVLVSTLLPSGEVVADSYTVPIQKCLRNKISLKFSSDQELPGEKISLDLTANPGSLCSLRAVDQSVLLMAPHEELTVDSVLRELPFQRMSGYPYNTEEVDPRSCYPSTIGVTPRVDWIYPPPRPVQKRSLFHFGFSAPNDIYSIFKEIGVKILTNSDVRKPIICQPMFPYHFGPARIPASSGGPVPDMLGVEGGLPGSAVPQGPGGPVGASLIPVVQPLLPSLQTVRTYFPETWIWDLVPVGDSGSAKVEHTVPDTITKWVAGAFCTSPTGFGLAPNTDLTAFQPFFVSLTLPYSVIRGEAFTLKATVFNYLSKCIMVQVNLNESAQYAAQPCEGCKYTHCLCGEESKTFKWILKPADLGEVSVNVRAEALRTEELCGNEVVTVPERGRIDTVVRTLLVEAEGTTETITHNALVCPAENPVERVISLKLPEVYINGSVKAFLSVLGDLMGQAMKNLGNLLAMPFGCGEQNMVLFVPNIYILNYLESTKQLTEEIKAKATRFLESGYQKELNYKHDDGSYSAFGKSDQSGNTWLTAFVLKSFGGARPYIFVDPKHISDARAWLAQHQQIDGCFRAVGKLFNNRMKGGVSDKISLTAYITAALLELDRSASDQMVARSLHCLRAASYQLDNLYTTALLSYTFTLAGDQEMRDKLITHLAKEAKTTGGSCHWEYTDASSKKTDSLEVEMTSYVLLALLSGPQLPDFGLDYASSIVRWLVQQQNPYGGFSSTQDTVVALQALSLYSAATFSPEGDTTVTVTSGGGYKREFVVNRHNRLLYQEERLTEVPGDYNVKAEGKGCTLVQIALHYNIPPPADFSAFSITAKVEGSCNSTRKALTVTVEVRYNGRRKETNMAILSIKLLSGYLLDKNSVNLLKNQHNVKHIEEGKGHVNIYIDELKKMVPSKYSLSIIEDIPVRNRKPAVVKIYDYYQTSDEAVGEYSSPCTEGDELNEL